MLEKEQIEQELNEIIEGMSTGAWLAFEELLEQRDEDIEAGKTQPDPEKVLVVLTRLLPSEREAVLKANKLLGRLHHIEAEENRSGELFAKQAMSVIDKARNLEPTADIDTLEDAIPVLERHGIKSGISEEALKMEIEVPYPPEEQN